MDIILTVLAFFLALGPLITFHEFGHFWVARRFGVQVQRFSIGFGQALWRRRGRDGTEYMLAALPLGGYVKMLDEREGEVPPEQQDGAFNRQPLYARMAILAAGPAFNLIFAVAAFWLMFMVGIPETRPVLGEPAGIAAQAGLQRGDRIVEINDEPVETWTHTLVALIGEALDRDAVTLVVEGADGGRYQRDLRLDRLETFDEERPLQSIGLQPWRPNYPAEIGELTEGYPAAEAGLRVGDRITAIGGEPVSDWEDVGTQVAAVAERQNEMTVDIVRNGVPAEVPLRPRRSDDGRWVLGILPPPVGADEQATAERMFTRLQYGPLAALPAALSETWRLTGATFGMLGRMLTGSASVKNLSGPISIARMAKDSAQLGVSRFLFFLGLVSLSLAILNLLPIPMLDGGQLLFMAIEGVRGKPLSERVQLAGQYVGLLALAGLMSLAIVNDILRLFD